MKLFFISIISIAILIVAYDIVRIYLLSRKTVALERAIKPFERKVPDVTFRILVLGDSTAVGTGATSPDDSTAGRLGLLYPKAEIINLGENGLKIAGLIEKLKVFNNDDHYDLIIIQIGANDIVQLTQMKNIEEGINTVLASAKKFGGKVIFLHSGNMGESTIFPWYVRPLFASRSFKVREIYMKAALAQGASYVDLIGSNIGEKIKENPNQYYAADQFHLSSEGYRLWYEEIIKKI